MFRLHPRFGARLEHAFRRLAPTMETRVVNIVGRAIGADRVLVVAHVDENMRMIERWLRADAHEFLGADPHLRNAWLVVEMRRGVCGHDSLDVLSTVLKALPFGKFGSPTSLAK